MPAFDAVTVSPPAEGEIVDPMAWFDSPGPFELEIGCGKGGFLLGRARAAPNARLLGIEWANKYYRYCADRMARWRINNARVMRTDAGVFVTRHLPPACLAAIHLYHPDPWPKKRHHKRRLVQPDFVRAVARALVPGGHWLIQSDHAEYFAEIASRLEDCAELSAMPWEEVRRDAGADWAGTNYEIKYGKEGREIFRAAYVRLSDPPAARRASP